MKIFIRIILFLALIIVINQLYYRFRKHGEVEDSSIWTNTIPNEYLQLLKLPNSYSNALNGNIIFVKTTVSKYRNPVSSFYIANKYYLQLYKMDTCFTYSLKSMIKESFLDAHSWIYTTYASDVRTDMEFLYKLTKPQKPKKIYLDLYGDSTNILNKNDTIAYYYSKCRDFSIKFNPQDANDIYGESKSQVLSEVPLEIMFIKRNNRLYMLILSAKNASTNLKQGTLYDLFLK